MGLFDATDEDKLTAEVMQDLGFEEQQAIEEPEPVQPVLQQNLDLEQGEPQQEVETEEQPQPELSEVEVRLAKAHLYNQIISSPLFEGTGAVVQEVEEEFQAFARKRLALLLGIEQTEVTAPVAEPQFSEEEVTILRKLIGRVSQSPAVLEPKAQKPKLKPQPIKPAEPVRTSVVAPKPAPKPAPKANARPALRARKVPEEVPQSRPQPKQVAPTTTTKPKPQPTSSKVIPANGSTIEENGKKYQIRYAKMPDIDEFGLMDAAKIRKLDNKQGCTISNGIQVFKDNNKYFKVLRTLVTSQEHLSGYVPFPSKGQSEMLLENAANKATAGLPRDVNAIHQIIKPPSLGDLLQRR